ncbi:hypothetical protein EVAR_2940_1 [Eumeta japonica]|uniref:Uncharacterized protein n=1 Tax=Eumeta variegata TaxID=151549 RepID=A0A4C1T1Y6_EUMVA|nr:hypothetical protein EVAR_2940_1 [Eumeta japonica]
MIKLQTQQITHRDCETKQSYQLFEREATLPDVGRVFPNFSEPSPGVMRQALPVASRLVFDADAYTCSDRL